ncbi:MurR/RpiR family transcriptional regulator [Bacillus carboniphilus]|uniref:MurR/RpiR family transcriptional regulator n=1 Tax=Bacillus carboniphilus TaxID=86663 RepID=A0ABP3FZ27_9BACI
MHNGGLTLLKESLQFVKPSERNAAQYILEHPDEVIHYSVQRLAEESNSSDAAIIRLCKTLGLKGFKDLKIRIAGDLQLASTIRHEYSEIDPGDDIPTLMKALANNHTSSLQQSYQSLDYRSIQKAVEYLTNANKIDFYAVGASQLVAQDAQLKFSRIGKSCTAYPDFHMQLISAVNLSSRDVAVGISYSGETNQVISAMKEAKKAGAITITITKFGSNTLNRLSDLNIGIIANESDIRSAATSSRVVQLYIIDCLYTGTVGANYDQAIQTLEKSRKVIKGGST